MLCSVHSEGRGKGCRVRRNVRKIYGGKKRKTELNGCEGDGGKGKKKPPMNYREQATENYPTADLDRVHLCIYLFRFY